MERGKYFQSNRKARVYLDAIGELIGRHGLTALLRLSKLHVWAEELPSYDDKLEVDFADIAILSEKLELMYGPRGGRALALRAGRAAFKDICQHYGDRVGLVADTLQVESPASRVRLVLEALAQATQLHSDSQVLLDEQSGDFSYTLMPCPECWCRSDVEDAVCHGTQGFLLEALLWAGLGDAYEVEQVACAVTDDSSDGCVFQIAKVS
jgi:hypothetical protein